MHKINEKVSVQQRMGITQAHDIRFFEEIHDAWMQELQQGRRYLLDCLEGALCDSPKWPLVRSRVLTVFGRDGLGGFSTRLNVIDQLTN